MAAPRGANRKNKANPLRPQDIRNGRLEDRRMRREQKPLTLEQKAAQTERAVERLEDARRAGELGRALGRHKILRALAPESSSTEKIWATVSSTFIFWTVIPFYVLQVIMWMISFAGISAEVAPLVNIVAPGNELFIIGYAAIALIGIGSMSYAALIYTLRGVRCFAGVRALMFMVCLAGYLVFFINLFPWILLWMLSVILAKTDDEED